MRLTAIVSAFAAAFPVISLLAPKGTVPLLVLATIAAMVAAWREGRRPIWPPRSLLTVIAAFLAWSLASAFWSLDAKETILTGARVGAVLLTGVAFFAIAASLDQTERARALKWLVFGILATLALIVIEYAFGYQIYRIVVGNEESGPLSAGDNLPARFNRGVTALALTVWPAFAALSRSQRTTPWLLYAAVAVALVISNSAASIVALIAGSVMWCISKLAPNIGRALVIIVPVLLLIASPFLAKEMRDAGFHQDKRLFSTAQYRVEIWGFTADVIEGRPLIGWGLDGARTLSALAPVSESTGRNLMPAHPHNAALQLLLEVGAVGGLLALIAILLVARQINNGPLETQPYLQATVMSLLIISMISFGLWQAHWLATIFGVATLAALSSPPLDAAVQERQTARACRNRVCG